MRRLVPTFDDFGSQEPTSNQVQDVDSDAKTENDEELKRTRERGTRRTTFPESSSSALFPSPSLFPASNAESSSRKRHKSEMESTSVRTDSSESVARRRKGRKKKKEEKKKGKGTVVQSSRVVSRKKNWFKKLKNEVPQLNYDLDDTQQCAVCYTRVADRLRSCHLCARRFHRECYGLSHLTTAQRFECDPCKHLLKQIAAERQCDAAHISDALRARFQKFADGLKCEICKTEDGFNGGLKKVKSQGTGGTVQQWAHVSCALYATGPRFDDARRMRHVLDAHKLDSRKCNLRCVHCETRAGFCQQCEFKDCTNAFHISCALRGKTELLQEYVGDTVYYGWFCALHSDASTRSQWQTRAQRLGDEAEARESASKRRRKRRSL